ncbi:single-stranded-DNA-specific exonuclease RecJ [Chloroflexus islandicus]|uniref:Single-stranded-DNA-specific exonuclease RecJ n=1 Tax=Chloroflexus islandicus TaxID=1707952 RepID=A0A178MB30_9CHLR|nr:single-stranded-DNA-specific exonuclease RecJ [Chloroflexus islandicus]OAN45959.1 single-stranded-DNA-specific exonuclease RecJ [Chloroflexus islandicus]
MSARRQRWEIRPPAPADVRERLGLPPLLATLLYQRGLLDPAAASAFLAADYATGLHDPFHMRGMAEAAARIAAAIDRGELMAVYGDFDVDGVTAVALLTQAIGAMGGRIRPYIPHRAREGYGLNNVAIGQLAADGVRLLITVDCGISNYAEVVEANRLGIDVIVTDHHHPPAELPPALAVVNPKQPDCAYPFKGLVGVGIAFKLIQALARYGKRPANLRGRDMLDLVALGTVADMGPLLDENRVLVRAGLIALNETARPGVRALMAAAGLAPGLIDSGAIAFALAPRLNAAGRLADARRAYELLLAGDRETADGLAAELNATNRERQALTRQLQARAEELVAQSGRAEQPLIVLASPEFNAGVIGLVAARIAETYHRPVVVIEQGGETSRGSARSIPGFSIIDIFDQCADLFVRYGGHAAAAGFTIATAQIPALEQRLLTLSRQYLRDDQLAPRLMIDAVLPLTELSWELYAGIQQLEPFGQGNPQPILMAPNVTAIDPQPTSDGAHLRMRVRAGNSVFEAIGFHFGRLAEALQRYPTIDLAYQLAVDEWNGQRRMRLLVRDFRRAGGARNGG